MEAGKHRTGGLSNIVTEMWIVQIVWALLCGLIGCIIAKDRIPVITGVICGTVLSCAGTWHIWYTLNNSLGLSDDKSAARKVGGGYLIRYLALIALVTILYFTKWGNPFAAFIAYLGMKPAAYLQPSLHKLLTEHRLTDGSDDKDYKDNNKEVR